MKRREFLGHVTATAACSLAATQCQAEALLATRIVDTHTHFYDPTRSQGIPWPEKGSSLYRAVYPKDWLEVASAKGVKETVVVEASTWLEDNQWILDLAKQNESIIGFVGNLSPQDIDFPKHLKRFAANPIFRGIRISGDLPKLLDDTSFRSGIGLMVDMGLELDINGPIQIQPAIVKLAHEYSGLRIVVNHVGSAGDPNRLTDEWRRGMAALGKYENVYCKVSALTEQSEEARQRYGTAPRDVAYYKPILDHCWSSFGEDNLIYGSNWPVCEKGGSYADQFSIVSAYFEGQGREASEKYFWKNAQRVYRWVE